MFLSGDPWNLIVWGIIFFGIHLSFPRQWQVCSFTGVDSLVLIHACLILSSSKQQTTISSWELSRLWIRFHSLGLVHGQPVIFSSFSYWLPLLYYRFCCIPEIFYLHRWSNKSFSFTARSNTISIFLSSLLFLLFTSFPMLDFFLCVSYSLFLSAINFLMSFLFLISSKYL